MGYASTRTCHVSAADAAADTCAALVFSYTEGVGACTGSSVSGSVATYSIAYAPSAAAPYTGTLEQTLQPCEPLTVADGIEISWGIIAAVVAAGAVLSLSRFVR